MFALFVISNTVRAQDTIYLAKRGERPFITCFKLEKPSTKLKTAVIVCSGGSYGRTADGEEGIPAAKLLAKNGITAFLLDYRIPKGQDSVSLADAQEAIRYVREHVGKYDIESNKIGIMGFSAGGHLVSTIGTRWKDNFANSTSAISAKPDFMVLVYPVISMADSLTHKRSRRNFLGKLEADQSQVLRFSNERQVSDQTPPAFLVAALDDDEVKVDNTLLFEAALREHKVPVESYLYAKGGHGFGIHNETTKAQWTDVVIPWIIKQQWKAK